MPAVIEGAVLRLSGAFDVAQVPELYRSRPRASTAITSIDLSAVTRIDSAGVALLQILRRQWADANGKLPRVTGGSEDFLHLCLAHRVEFNGG